MKLSSTAAVFAVEEVYVVPFKTFPNVTAATSVSLIAIAESIDTKLTVVAASTFTFSIPLAIKEWVPVTKLTVSVPVPPSIKSEAVKADAT